MVNKQTCQNKHSRYIVIIAGLGVEKTSAQTGARKQAINIIKILAVLHERMCGLVKNRHFPSIQ